MLKFFSCDHFVHVSILLRGQRSPFSIDLCHCH